MADGANVNWQSAEGCPLLHYAVTGGHTAMVTLLLVAGAQVNARTRDHVTPLINGIEWGYVEIVKILLAHGADSRAQAEYGRTALKLAIEHQQSADIWGDMRKNGTLSSPDAIRSDYLTREIAESHDALKK